MTQMKLKNQRPEEGRKEQSRVVVVPCGSYDPQKVYEAMRAGIEALGGLKSMIDPSEKILVKPNFLSAALPEKAVTTHPAVITAMFRILWEEGYARVSYGDSPGHGSCETASRKLDLEKAAEEYGVVRANMEEEALVSFPDGKTAKSFYFTKGAAEADAIINVCKMKTHALERITGAVKNVYGFVCGARKAAGHVKYPNASIFARMLADIHRCTDIRLHIMDGIMAMEGNGPGSGDPIPMSVLLFSRDPVALDAVYCRMIHLNPEMVPTCAQGEAMGIGTCQMENIEIVQAAEEGGNLFVRPLSLAELEERFGNAGFRVDRKGEAKGLLGRYSSVMTRLSKRPVIRGELCVRCGICVSHCPVPGKAVDFKKGKDQPPVYDYQKCIRCYCCQEMCPQHAITVKR